MDKCSAIAINEKLSFLNSKSYDYLSGRLDALIESEQDIISLLHNYLKFGGNYNDEYCKETYKKLNQIKVDMNDICNILKEYI